MTEDQIASIQYAADWLSRSEDIGNRKHGERLSALLYASRADTAGAKPDGWIRMDHLRQAQQAPFMCRVEPEFRPGLDLAPIYLAAPPTPSVAAPMTREQLIEHTAREIELANETLSAPSVAETGYAFRSDGKLWVTQSLAVAERWKAQGFEITPVTAAAPSVADAAGASVDARDAARYRAKRAFAVSMGVTENNDDYDKDSDSMVAAIKKSPAMSDELKCTCKGVLGHSQECAMFDESMMRYEPFGNLTAGVSEGQAEPVGLAGTMPGTDGFTMAAFKASDVPVGTPLYLHPSAEIAALRERIAGMEKDAIRSLIARHAEELEQNDYAYFELAYTRRTGWMAWICSNSRDDDPNRKVIACGQGDTPDEACDAAIAKEKQG
ncbi:hypothetical protein AWB76_06269 [Caballeronia temeraria]|uniref:Uncharacterized protein n=1 Tax=Caballeronia temeraria TaxID=1777137 RepID=A0A158D0M8_9BURK|nr:hypothetical protein [Caballeronia temeraria]SAK88031.1 hypothetical protein AWB76_06269 [Caballeronia temeraria]